jgi:TRAP-type C4-dicarboxylate transport system permease small subunit
MMVRRIGEATSTICSLIAALALTSIVLVNGVNVVSRYFFGSAFAWAEELMIFLMVLTVFAGAATATWRGAHIRIDLLTERLGPRLRVAAAAAVSLAGILVLATLAVVSFRIVSMLYAFDQRSLALDVPLWIPQGFVAVGLVLMIVMTVLKIIVAFQQRSALDGVD